MVMRMYEQRPSSQNRRVRGRTHGGVGGGVSNGSSYPILQCIPVIQQPRFDVWYKSVKVGEYIPDLICFDKIVVDTKTIERITDHEMGQMLNYLKITGLRLGLIINFKYAKLEWRRVVL